MATPQSKPTAAKKKDRSGKPGGRPPGAPVVKKATARDWIGGARLRTLPLAIAPVALGAGSAQLMTDHEFHWARILLCLAVALSLQIAVNYANDYSDGVRGTDKHRVGPSRLTGSGAARPRTVLAVSMTFFALAAIAGIIIVVVTGYWWLLAVGAVSIVAGWFYTGGKRPYGYYALGEVFVFIFFGLVATAGTTFVITGQVNFESWLTGTAIGLFACGVLMVNNLRDREQDKAAGKRTLAVRIGDRGARIAFAVLVLLPFVAVALLQVFYPNAGFTYFVLLAIAPAVLITITGKTPAEFILALQLTSLGALLYGLLLAWAIAF